MKKTYYILILFSFFLQAQVKDNGFGLNGDVVLTEIAEFGGYAIQPDGKILISGKNTNSNPILIRIDTNGNLDPTFGSNGKFILTTKTSTFLDPKVLSNGSIIIYDIDSFIFLKLTSNGVLDTAFNNQIQYTSWFRDFVVLSNGKIIYCAETALLRYNADGSPDTTFGNNGILGLSFSASEQIDGIEIDPITNTMYIKSRVRTNGNFSYRYKTVTQNGVISNPIALHDVSKTFKFTFENLFISGYTEYDGGSVNITFTHRFDSSFLTSNTFRTPYNFGYYNLDVTVPEPGKIIQLNQTSTDVFNLQIVKLKETYPQRDISFGTNGEFIFNPGFSVNDAFVEFDDYSNALYVIVYGGNPRGVQITRFKQINLSTIDVAKSGNLFYPNPAENTISLSKKIKFVNIFTLDGKKININFMNNKVDISTLIKGVYILKMEDENGNVKSEKLIKK